MKALRIIAAVLFTALTLAANCGVVAEWSRTGCSAFSMILGCAWYSLLIIGTWFAIDTTLKGK